MRPASIGGGTLKERPKRGSGEDPDPGRSTSGNEEDPSKEEPREELRLGGPQLDDLGLGRKHQNKGVTE